MKSTISFFITLLLTLLAIHHTSPGQEPADTNYDEAKVPKYSLPDPLVCFDGRKISDAAMWRDVRRGEIVRAFATHIYGRTPDVETRLRFETRSTDAQGTRWTGDSERGSHPIV